MVGQRAKGGLHPGLNFERGPLPRMFLRARLPPSHRPTPPHARHAPSR